MNRIVSICSVVILGVWFASVGFAQDVETSAKAMHQSLSEEPVPYIGEASRIITRAKMAERNHDSVENHVNGGIVKKDPTVGSVVIIGGRVNGSINLAPRNNGVTIIDTGH